MYIDIFKNNGTEYIRLRESYRTKTAEGKVAIRKRTICNIGPLSKFDDGQPDYLERLRESFRLGNPLIPELTEYTGKKPPIEKYSIRLQEGDPECVGHPQLYSHVFLDKLFDELGLEDFFRSYKGFSKIQYDVLNFVRLLVYGRILNPDSKMATLEQNDDYYTPLLKNFNKYNVYDTLDFIYENKEKIIRRMNTSLVKKWHRNPEIIFYDVTNFFFEIEDPDEDVLDEYGNVIEKGFRKIGVSKENRKQPIVQMGLFMDDQGLPISIESFPGNTLDANTFKPAISKSIDGLEYARFIMIADRGMCNYQNVFHLLDQNNGYILAKSLLKSTKAEQEWAYSDDGFIQESRDFKYKSRIMKRTVKDANGKKRTVTENVIVYWSRNFYERDLHENARFLETLEKILKNPKGFRITDMQARMLRPFFKSDFFNSETGEVIAASKLKALLDKEKLEEFKSHFGYYQIITSEINMPPLEAIEKYHGLTRIEDQFRVMKSDLETRPVYVRTREHIEAHLLICLIALTMIRMIQCKICHSGLVPKSDDITLWSMGLPAYRIQKALNKWKVELLADDLYRFTDLDDPDLKLILDSFDIRIPAKLFRKTDLKSQIRNINVTI
ncbi:IS1634 family transposase [uncultured Dubosiella sp.]|uniref:IS1634 family transposase n=1 Tax=uncultured Dubosiella sp. TaxID=1937011 RepID=UPI0026297EE5|nr:IS1634 family transposase [uncultured Dubosiella sp.]